MAIKDPSKPYILQEPAEIAQKYGGNKQKIAAAAQRGIIDPTAAVLAGMFIDEMRTAAAQEQIPTQTVAEQVFAPSQPQMPAGLGATPQAAQMATPQRMMTGIDSLPVSDDMVPDEYAGGGIVAFAEGDVVRAADGKYFPRFDELPVAGGDAVVPGNELSSFFSRMSSDQRRIDPETGEAVSLGEYMRRVDARRVAAARAALPVTSPVATPATPPAAAAAPAANVAATTPTAPATPPVPPRSTVIPEAAKELTPEQFKTQQKQFGIDEKWKGKVEALIDKMGASAGDREQAKNMALLQAGLGIMGGQSPYALQNIGEGAKAAVAQYSKDVKDIRTAERDADKLRIEVAKAEDAQKRGDFKAFQEHNEKAREYALKLRKAELDEKQTAAYVQAATRPTEEQLRQKMFAEDPEKFRKYQESMRPGFETAETARLNNALKGINDTLLTGRIKKDSPEYKQLMEQRQLILNKLSGTGPAVPPNVQSVIDKYLNKPQ